MPGSHLYLVTGGLTGFQLREYLSRDALRVCLAEANAVPAGIMVKEQNFFPKALCKLSHRRICRKQPDSRNGLFLLPHLAVHNPGI
jgi:hypothetical protein